MPVFTDMLGRVVHMDGFPKRIVSIVPSQTELLHDLGLEEEVVGITKFCVHPAKWFREKQRVGGTKTVNIDHVRALMPDLILANKEENVAEQIAALQIIAPVWVSDIKNLDEALVMIKAVSVICNRAEKGIEIAETISKQFAILPGMITTPSEKVAYAIWYKPWMWAGGDTFITDMLQRCGWHNVLQDEARYPALDLVHLAALQPGIVLLSSEPFPFKNKHIEEVKAALPNAKIMLVDGELFSWYGSRLLQSASYFHSLMRKIL